MSKDLFAPPTKDEIAAAQAAIKRERDLFAPPTGAELKALEKPKTSLGMSALRGAAQGASFGWIDEASAAIGAAKDALTSNVDYSTAYQAWKDAIRGADKQAQKDNPVTYGVGNMAGMVGATLVPGGKALNATKYTTATGRVAAAGAAGALGGAGASDTSPLRSFADATQFAGDVATGGAIGAVTQGAVDAVAPMLHRAAERVPAWLSGAAEQRAVKAAVGNQQKVMDTLKATGQTNKLGRELLDRDVVTFGRNPAGIAKAAGAEKSAIGARIGELVNKVDEATPAVVDSKKIADDILKFASSIDSPNNEAVVSNLMKQAEKFEQMGSISLGEAQRLKNQYLWKFGETPSLTRDATNRLKGIIGDEMEAAVGRFDELAAAKSTEVASRGVKTGTGTVFSTPTADAKIVQAVEQAGEGLTAGERSTLAGALKQEIAASKGGDASKALAEYQGLKSSYGAMDTAKRAATKLATRQEKNRTFSLTDYIFGGVVGGATMNPVPGVLAASGNKVLRERGSSMAAVALDKLAEALRSSPKAAETYIPRLTQAATGGTNTLYQTHLYLLANDNAYREAFAKSEKQAAINRRIEGSK